MIGFAVFRGFVIGFKKSEFVKASEGIPYRRSIYKAVFYPRAEARVAGGHVPLVLL